MKPMQSKVFVGSSSEGKDVAHAIKRELNDRDIHVTVWDEDQVFRLGESVLASLVSSLRAFDYAILVFRADDSLKVRDKRAASVRDNVLFELGLFMGHLGPRRTFVVYDRARPAKIISDLSGITFATYDGADEANSVRTACDLIRREIKVGDTERWYTEYLLNGKRYLELLSYSVFTCDVPVIIGRKMYMEHGKDTVIYDLRGFRGEGFDWLEYHRPDGTGGGAIMLRTGTPSVRSGLIMAGHCDTGNLRCYANRWVRVGNDFDFSDPNLVPAYKSQWLRKPVDVSPNELDSLPAEAPRRKSE